MHEGMKISIRNGRLIDPASGIDREADLHCAEGKVVAIGAAPAGFQPDRTLDARGLVVCPGLVDLSARLREPGDEQKATIASETRAAAAAGITTPVLPAGHQPDHRHPGGRPARPSDRGPPIRAEWPAPESVSVRCNPLPRQHAKFAGQG